MKKILSLLTLLMFSVMGAWASTVDDLVAVTAPTTFVMDGLNGTSALVKETLYADNQLLSLGGSGYSTSKGKTTYNEVEYTNVYQIKNNRQIALKIGFDAVVTIFGQTHNSRAWQIGTTSAGNDVAAGAKGDAVVSGAVDGSVTPQVIYINATSDLYLAGIEIKAAAPVEKTVTFVNDADWENVYAYAWNDDGNLTGEFPGVAMTDTGETEDGHKVYSWATTGDPKWILFNNNGSALTSDCDFVDGGKYNSAGRVIIKNDYTLKFKTEKDWDEVYAYAWNDTENSGWKSAKMTLTGGVYTATVQLENEPTNVLFHNGLEGGDQDKTPDLAYEADKTYEFMKNVYTATFKTDAAWEHVYAYTWTGESLGKVEELGTWPGKELEAEAGVYNLTISTFGDAPANIIFNGNSEGQTPDYAFTNGRAYKWITATPIYAITEGMEAISAGTVINVKDAEEDVVATLTYGTGGDDFGAATNGNGANDDYAGFQYMTLGNGINGDKENGTVYFIEPKYDGTIAVGVRLNADKAFYIMEDGEAMEGYNGIKIAAATNLSYSFPVKGGSTYKIYCAGSKLGFFGFDYTGYTKPVPTAEITKVEVRGGTEWDTNFDWTNDVRFELAEASANTYTGVIDLTSYTSDYVFKLVVNDGANWIGWNALTLDADGMVSGVKEEDGCNFILANSTSGYQTYNVTATWVPNADASANWTLKIEGKDARVVPEDVYTLVGAFYNSDEAQAVFFGTAWDASVEANNMVKGSDGIYTKSYEDVDLEVGTIQLKVVKNNWEASYPAMNYEIHIADAGKYDVAFTFNPTTEEVTAVATPKFETFYTVAGSYYPAEGETLVFGTSWDPTDTNNDMELGTDGIYTLTLTEKELLPGTLNYKVVKNHNWDNGNWGMNDKKDGNAEYNINVAGKYDITIKFNPVATFTNGYHVDCEVTTTPTGIQNVKADNLKGAEVYNLAGQRMAQPAKGLYIVNGRKVVIK